jgi:hypothetical protein
MPYKRTRADNDCARAKELAGRLGRVSQLVDVHLRAWRDRGQLSMTLESHSRLSPRRLAIRARKPAGCA